MEMNWGRVSAVVFFIGIMSLFSGCASVAKSVANSVYPALPAVKDFEAPPTITSYLPSSDIAAVIGGRGEGVSCSIPSLVEQLIFPPRKGNAPLSMQFRQACVYHDMCYRHGEATYGYQQSHCDFALQNYAYRLCRQFERGSHEECEEKARVVLLGVALFGGKSFQAGGDSTFYEFDPIPLRADDYVVGRILNNGEASNLYSLHFKGHTVGMRKIDWRGSSSGKKSEYPWFPKNTVPTPPVVIHDDAKGDRLLSVTRTGLTSTEYKLVEFPLENVGNAYPDKLIGDHDASMSSLRKTSSGVVATLVNLRQKEKDNNKVFIKVFSCPIGKLDRKGNQDCQNGQPCKDHDNCTGDSEPVPVGGNYYRYAQHPALFYRLGDKENLVLISRGVGQEAEDYTSHATVKSIPLNGGVATEKSVSIPENDEPLVSVNLSSADPVLLGLRNTNKDSDCTDGPYLVQYQLAETTTLERKSICLKQFGIDDASWLKQPVQIFRPRTGGVSYAFFSRVALAGYCTQEGVDCKESIQKDAKLSYEFIYLTMAKKAKVEAKVEKDPKTDCPTGFLSIGGQRVCRFVKQVDIARQLFEATKTEDAFGIKRKDACCGANAENNWQELVRKDIIRRWQQSQVIPVVMEGGMLDAAVLFNGYPDYSRFLK